MSDKKYDDPNEELMETGEISDFPTMDVPPPGLKYTQRGEVRASDGNAMVLVEHMFGRYLSYDSFLGRTLWDEGPDWREPGVFTSDDVAAALKRIENAYNTGISKRQVGTALMDVAKQNRVDVGLDYRASLPRWDGERRALHWPRRYWGNKNPRANRFAWRWALSAGMRLVEPGCTAEGCIVLIGNQGRGKTRFLRSLPPDTRWFKNDKIDINSRDGIMSLRGCWIREIAEFAAFKHAGIENIKGFLSIVEDTYREPYAAIDDTFPRRVVFAATHNEADFLVDMTGNRRFWPIEVDRPIDIQKFIRERDQFWAEVFHFVDRGEQHWLTDEEFADLVDYNQQFTIEDPFAELLRPKLEKRLREWEELVAAGKDYVSEGRVYSDEDEPAPWVTAEICAHFLEQDYTSRNVVRKITNALCRLGWERKRSSRYIDGGSRYTSCKYFKVK